MPNTRRIAFLIVLIGCASFALNSGRRDSPILPADPESKRIEPFEAAGLHNTCHVSDRIYSGSSPEGDTGFTALKDLGIKTIISVDGARPDVELARKHGMTYVHLPFGYDGIPRDRLLGLVKAAQMPGPIYVHCHHGKHRGPAAVAAIQLCTDSSWDAAKAEEWLKLAGSDSRYTGLVGLPQSLERPTAEELARVPDMLPEVAMVPDLARLMVEIDGRWDHLKLAKAAGWKEPKDHPDIDPPHEALQLVEHYREAARLDVVRTKGTEFASMIMEAEQAGRDLEDSLRVKPIDMERIAKAFNRATAACTSCHERFRDRPSK